MTAKKKPARPRPGPGGSLIVPANFRPRGNPRGVSGPPRTKKQLAALRTNGFRNQADGLTKKYELAVERGDGKRAKETLEAILEATEGRFGALARVNAGKLARLSTIQDAALDEVEKDGVTLREDVTDSDGRVLGSRRREHPALGAALRLGEVVGVSAKDQLLTPAARGASRKDDAVVDYLQKQDKVRGWLAEHPPVDAEVVEEDK